MNPIISHCNKAILYFIILANLDMVRKINDHTNTIMYNKEFFNEYALQSRLII